MTATASGNPPTILTLEGEVSVEQAASASPELKLDLRLGAGRLLMMEVADQAQAELIADLCSGLTPMTRGETTFLGLQWPALTIDESNRLRGRIGRSFSPETWLEQLTVEENVILREAHHTRRRLLRIRRDATALAARFGLPGLPALSPRRVPRGELARANLVRAFLGNPALVLLLEPTAGLPTGLMSAIINVILELRVRGTSVIWLTEHRRLTRDRSIPASARCRILGGELTWLEEGT